MTRLEELEDENRSLKAERRLNDANFRETVFKKLDSIHSRMDTCASDIADIKAQTCTLATLTKDHQTLLYGKVNEEGLVEKVHSLESSEKKRVWLVRALITGFIALLVEEVCRRRG